MSISEETIKSGNPVQGDWSWLGTGWNGEGCGMGQRGQIMPWSGAIGCSSTC